MSDTSAVSTAVKPSRVWKTLVCTLLLAGWIVLAVLVFGLVRLLAPAKVAWVYRCFHWGCYRIFSIKCTVQGQRLRHRPSLFLANHISYLDVFILGSMIPGYFIAKSEVAGWPLLGSLAKLQNTLFFERKGQKIRQQLQVMASHFDNGGNLILFPEGTSTEGEHVGPFKSSLLQALEDSRQQVQIQAVTIAYTHYRQQKMTRFIRDHYAWYASMPFAAHFFSALGMASAEVTVIFHEPVSLDAFVSRKACAQYCWQQVNNGLSACLAD
ncbi:MAG: 1-acyl-sn-glycerol-3-phosphate acyltransferase [Cellvibrionaceae bacterium]|nr:1-acyl-sn-glycerol-3-phosphate acyltransferase [Cellvibrionaceae bacterium]